VLRGLAIAGAFVLLAARPGEAQSGLKVSVATPPSGARIVEGTFVTIEQAFADARSSELLASGFPARVTTTVELWASRTLFDDLLQTITTERVVRYDLLSKTFRVARVVSPDSVVEEGRHATLTEMRSAMSQPMRVPLVPPRGRRRLYYTANVTIETFSSNDLAEVQRWLNGDVEPALRGEKNAASALKRGILTLFSRLLGGDVKRQNARSGTFDS
jgi:hypothetical protein